MHIKDINPFLTDSIIQKYYKELQKNHKILNKTVHQRKDRSRYTVQSYVHKFTYNNKPAYVIFDTDISSEIELQQNYEKQAKILDFIHDSIISTDKQGKITSWNKGSMMLFGYSQEEMLGKNILQTYAKDNKYAVEELFSLLDTQNSLEVEAYMVNKDNKKILCR